MRAIGLILVVFGAVGLGLLELRETGKKLVVSDRASASASENTQKAILPVVSGIAVTSGLILMASALKRT